MKIKLKKKNINLYQMTNLSFDKKFEIFYTFRFNEDYLKNDLNNKKISKKKSKYWFQNNHKKKKLFAIRYNKKIIGLIIYNLNDYYYSIVIKKNFRNRGFGKKALIKFINILKKKSLPLQTLVKKKNYKSLKIHKKISKSSRSFNKFFYYFKII